MLHNVNNNQVYRLNSGSSTSAVNPGENSYKPHMLWNHSSLASFLSRTVKAMLIQSRIASSESHIIRTSSVPSVGLMRTLSWIGYSRSFKVILIGAGRNPERRVVVRAINADVISETYEDMATGKRQIRQFQRPRSGLKTSQQETPSTIYKWFIILPETRVIDLHFCRW